MHQAQTFSPRLFIALALAALLAGCGGGETSTGSTSPSSAGFTSSAGNSSSGSCSYPDLLTSTEKSKANACGPQASTTFAMADSGLQSVISTCQRGDKATADAYYASTYTQSMVTQARRVLSTVCR